VVKIASVVPDVTGLDKVFDYLVPESMVDRVSVGSMVRVPLHGRRVGGWVIRVGEHSPEPLGEALDAAHGTRALDVPLERLVPIAKWSGIGPDADVVDLAVWAAHRWSAGRLRPLLVSASPPRMVQALGRLGVAIDGLVVARRQPEASEGARRLLADGGGVIRIAPSDDPLPIVLAAVEVGRCLVVHPSGEVAGLLAARLRGHGLGVAVLPDGWPSAAADTADVVIGPRSAIWATMPRLAAIVVLDEHDEALQEERTPTWHARDLAIERGRRAGAPVLLVSPCPTVTALAWSGARWMRPEPEAERDGWPEVELVDRRGEEPWKRSLLTGRLIELLRDPSRRVVCVHNAPGRARLLACRTCRSLLHCERCEAAVQQLDDRTLHCHRCGTDRPPVCQQCGSSALANVRPGVTRLREELEAAAGRPVVAVTGGSDELLAVSGVYVGTEAVLHRVREADVVAFVDIDAELLAPRYRAAEQSMSLLVRAARLLGAHDGGGLLLIQTFRPDHEVLQAVVHRDPGRLARLDGPRRRALGLPPFGALARVSGPGAAEYVESLGVPAAVDGDGFLVRAGDWGELGDALSEAVRPKGARMRIEVDPPRR
jgi:primosomal protein N' (replication factor Y) (superfamily II helicase)